MQKDQTQPERREGFGYLPSCAPLANPYVPFQQNDPAHYALPQGLVRGTLFPGLDLPFMGMGNESDLPSTPLHELQALGFAIDELVLYLDTHSDDREAAELLASYRALYQKGMALLQEQSGPLFAMDGVVDGAYEWLRAPWPWEYPAAGKNASGSKKEG